MKECVRILKQTEKGLSQISKINIYTKEIGLKTKRMDMERK